MFHAFDDVWVGVRLSDAKETFDVSNGLFEMMDGFQEFQMRDTLIWGYVDARLSCG